MSSIAISSAAAVSTSKIEQLSAIDKIQAHSDDGSAAYDTTPSHASSSTTDPSTPALLSPLASDTIPDADLDTDLDWQRTLQECLQPLATSSKPSSSTIAPDTATSSQTSRPAIKPRGGGPTSDPVVHIPVLKKPSTSPTPIKTKAASKASPSKPSPAVIPTIIIPVKDGMQTLAPSTLPSLPSDPAKPSAASPVQPLVKPERKPSDPDVEGTTCHRCSRKLPGAKMSCTSSGRRSNEACTLRFCRACVTKHFPFPFDPSVTDFVCPKCTRTCNCTRCKKRPALEAGADGSALAEDGSLELDLTDTATAQSETSAPSTVFIRGGHAIKQHPRTKIVPLAQLPSGLVGHPSIGKRSRAGSLLWNTGAIDLASSDVDSSGDESDAGGGRPTKRKNRGANKKHSMTDPERLAAAVANGEHPTMPCGIVGADPMVVSMAALEGHFDAMGSAGGISHPQFTYSDDTGLDSLDMEGSRALEWLTNACNYANPSLGGVAMDVSLSELDFAAAAAAAAAATSSQFDAFGPPHDVYGSGRAAQPSPFKVDHVHFTSASSSSSYSLYDYDGGWSPEGSASASTAATSISGRATSDSVSPGPCNGMAASTQSVTSTLQEEREDDLDEDWKEALCEEALRDEEDEAEAETETERTVAGDDDMSAVKKVGCGVEEVVGAPGMILVDEMVAPAAAAA